MPRRLGIDCTADRTLIASSDVDSGAITDVTSYGPDDSVPFAEDVTAVTCAVPDNLCQVKALRLSAPTDAELRMRAEFELAQTQLESPELFQFELVPTALEQRMLGLIHRRESLAKWQASHANAVPAEGVATQFRSRALALGLGYLNCCRPVGGEFLCVVDFSRPVAAVCFIYRRLPVDLARLEMPTAPFDDTAARRLAIDFKTVVNFRLMALSEAGISIPLSRLIVSGAPESVLPVLEEFFPVGVVAPEPDSSRLPDGLTADFPGALVALGLLVN